MILQGGSTMYLMPHTHVEITNNHAKRGGGIFVEDENTATTIPCFFQLLNQQYPYSHINAVVTLENNTADEAGSTLYGGKIDQYFLHTHSQQFIYNTTVFTSLFKIFDNTSAVSTISSSPVAVHFCITKQIFLDLKYTKFMCILDKCSRFQLCCMDKGTDLFLVLYVVNW